MWKELYYEKFTEEQRKIVREGGIWPPEDFAGVSAEEEDESDEDEEEYEYEYEEVYE